MTAQIYYKIQNTYALLGNKQYEFVIGGQVNVKR